MMILLLYSEPSHVLDPPVLNPEKSHVEELPIIEMKTDDSKEDESELVSTKAAVPPESQPKGNHIFEALDPASCNAEEDAPKKSYASIVSAHSKKGSSGTVKMYVPTNAAKVDSPKSEKHLVNSISQDPDPAPAPAASVPNAPASNNAGDEGIYIPFY